MSTAGVHKHVIAKMDTAKALGLMGFSGTRAMDRSSGNDPKDALDKALFNQMQLLAQRKKDAIKVSMYSQTCL